MKYVKLGRTGLDVSRICLGCMSFGAAGKGPHAWTLGEKESRAILKQSIEHGINFFDTANGYSEGSSEEIVGRAVADFTQRDEVVIATKVFIPMRSGPNAAGLSRKAILTEVDASLRRLATDYIDLYQVHRWDSRTPIEETMEALHDVVRAGKVRYVGASSMFAWQFSKALYSAQLRGWSRFVSMQNHYNLLNREEEREMLPLCEDQGIAVIPWSPLARGRLTRDWDEETERSRSDEFGRRLYDTSDSDRIIVERLKELSDRRALPRAQIALAWTLHKDVVTAPIVGATQAQHVEDAVASLDVSLSKDEMEFMEAPYTPHPVVGFA